MIYVISCSLIKSMKNSSNHFDIRTFIKFYHHSTKSSSCNKLKHIFTSSNKQRKFYFNSLPRTFNSLPTIDLTRPFLTIKEQFQILWQNFMKNFDPDTYTAFIFVVPAASATKTPNHQTLLHTIGSGRTCYQCNLFK